jgi:hypothetical protein
VAADSKGFSMAYVQEIVLNAFLTVAHRGDTPNDSDLVESLAALKSQRQNASKSDETLAERESIGFAKRRNNSDPFGIFRQLPRFQGEPDDQEEPTE